MQHACHALWPKSLGAPGIQEAAQMQQKSIVMPSSRSSSLWMGDKWEVACSCTGTHHYQQADAWLTARASNSALLGLALCCWSAESNPAAR